MTNVERAEASVCVIRIKSVTPLQLEQYVEVLIELAEWLRRTLDVNSISIAAHSRGQPWQPPQL